MKYFKIKTDMFVQAIQLSSPLTIEIDAGKLRGVIGDWLVMSQDGIIVTIIPDLYFWCLFAEFEE